MKTYIGYAIGIKDNTRIIWEITHKKWSELLTRKQYSAYFAYEINDNGEFRVIKGFDFDKTFDELSMKNYADEWISKHPIFYNDSLYDSFEFRIGNYNYV